MTVAFVQEKPAYSLANSATPTVTLDSAVTAGNVVLLVVKWAGSTTLSSVSGLGATWTQIATTPITSANITTRLYKGVGGSGAGAITVTFSASTSQPDLHATEWSGVGTITGTAAQGSSTAPAGTAVILAAGDAAFTMLYWENNPSSPTNGDTPAAWTALTNGTETTFFSSQFRPAYRIASSSETAQHKYTLSASEPWDHVTAQMQASAPTVAAALTATRSARGFTSTVGKALSAAVSAGRVSRTFTVTATARSNNALTLRAARMARGFGLMVSPQIGTATGPPATPAPWTRNPREFFGGAADEPPVVAPPATISAVLYRRLSYAVDPPTFATDGWSNPTQEMTAIYDAPWRRHRLRFASVDRTYFRGVPVQLVRWGFSSPFGPDTAVVRIPQITPFERPGVGDISWLIEGKGLRLDLIEPNGTVDPTWTWIGQCQSITPVWTDTDFAFEAEYKGFGYQAADYRQKPLPIARDAAAVDIGKRLADTLNVTGRHYPAVEPVVTGLTTRKRGSLTQTAMDFARELLADTVQPDGSRYTVVATPGTRIQALQIVAQDRTAADYTISLGQPGCDFSGLAEDNDELPNVVYGEWVDANGGRHQRLKWPRYLGNTAPPFPLAIGSSFAPGSGTTGLQDFSDWMRANGYGEFDSQNTYLASDEDDVQDLQRQMGVLVNGLVDANTWGTAFNTGGAAGNLKSAVYLPIAIDPRVEPWLYGPDGKRLGMNPAWDAHIRRKETYLNFGEGLTYRQVRKAGQQIVNRTTSGIPSLVGRIICTTDPEETSWLNAVAGTTLRVRYLYGSGSSGILFHVASLLGEPQDDGTVRVTLDVDTMWRDAVTVADIIERNKAAREDPARQIRARRSSTLAQDTKIQFDADDVGHVYPVAMLGGRWRIVEIPAATWGTFVRVVATTAPDVEFAVGLFEKEITERDLDRLVGDPLASGNTRPWTPDAAALADVGLIQCWGSPSQPCGYSKTGAADGYKSEGDPLTGRLEYDSNVDFAPQNGASLFVAVWVAHDTKFAARLYLQPVEF